MKIFFLRLLFLVLFLALVTSLSYIASEVPCH